MYSIGELSRRTGVKVPTIRYYEDQGLIAATLRTAGNQRRFGDTELEQLSFIKHGRDLGFPLEAIQALIRLQDHPDRNCKEATDIAQHHLTEVRRKIDQLTRLEQELSRISQGCSGKGAVENCTVLASLGDHRHCQTDH